MKAQSEFPLCREHVIAVKKIIHRRLTEAAVLIEEDVDRLTVAQSMTIDSARVQTVWDSPRYALRKGLRVWNLIFDGQSVELKHEKGILYVSYLLKNPPDEPLNALDLAARIPAMYRKQLGIAATANLLTGEIVLLEKHSRLQERSLGLEDKASAKAVWKESKKLEAILDDPTTTEPEKAEALRELEAITEFQQKHCRQTKSNADNMVRSVRKAIRRFQGHLEKADREDGTPEPVCRAFAAHLKKISPCTLVALCG